MTTRVLFVDDDVLLRDTIEVDLVGRGYAVETAESASAAIAAMQRADFDVVVTDLAMPAMNGVDLCRTLVERRGDVPVIVLTAFGSLEAAVDAMRAGAYDFLSKPIKLDVLALAIERAAERRRLRGELRRLERVVQRAGNEPLEATSAAMRSVLDLVERIAPSESTVLVTGESGTGKEVIARAIHARGRRADKPFVAINCAAVPETLLESELFGHVRGAFTDAKTNEPGLFVGANGGTLFLDEIGDMPLAVQPKVLRVLQERTVRPVGGSTERAIDVRVIAATNHDLETAVEEGRFRGDLYYRINVVNVALPPLRARGPDILPLAIGFLRAAAERSAKQVTGIAPAAAERLMAFPWPGNIRELQNCIEHAVALARYEELAVDDLPAKVRSFKSSHVLVAGDDPSDLVPLEQVERRYVARVMAAVGGNKSAAARVLQVDRKRLYRMLDRLGLAK